METLVVNLFGTPSAGKSRGMAYIFSKLKMAGINAEFVAEFAKEKVWENNEEVFKNQAYIFGKQYFRTSRLLGKVDVIVTDSPLLLSSFYNKSDILGEIFNQTVLNVFKSLKSLNFLLIRDGVYNPKGRFQTEEESNALVKPMIELLDNNNIQYETFLGKQEDYDKIVDIVIDYLGA